MDSTQLREPALRVSISAQEALLEGALELPPNARGVVVLVHGSGISRGPQDALVAQKLQEAGLGTLLLNLLTPREQDLDARTACFRFDVSLLAGRLSAVADWLSSTVETSDLVIGYFGAGNAGAAALIAAAERPDQVAAIVIQESRTEQADPFLSRVAAATLFIASDDDALVFMNRASLEQVGTRNKRFECVANTPDLLADLTALEEAARLTVEWFRTHLNPFARSAAAPSQVKAIPAPMQKKKVEVGGT